MNQQAELASDSDSNLLSSWVEIDANEFDNQLDQNEDDYKSPKISTKEIISLNPKLDKTEKCLENKTKSDKCDGIHLKEKCLVVKETKSAPIIITNKRRIYNRASETEDEKLICLCILVIVFTLPYLFTYTPKTKHFAHRLGRNIKNFRDIDENYTDKINQMYKKIDEKESLIDENDIKYLNNLEQKLMQNRNILPLDHRVNRYLQILQFLVTNDDVYFNHIRDIRAYYLIEKLKILEDTLQDKRRLIKQLKNILKIKAKYLKFLEHKLLNIISRSPTKMQDSYTTKSDNYCPKTNKNSCGNWCKILHKRRSLFRSLVSGANWLRHIGNNIMEKNWFLNLMEYREKLRK